MSRRRDLFLLWSVLCALSIPVFAANRPAGVVAALQSPAWLERARHRTPLAPGVALQAGDIVETGAGARVEIQMGDDSTVKLGEQARFVLAQWSAPAQEGVVHGALRVLRGAFRYTAHVLAQAKQRRELTVDVASVTIGIRGTDVWGRANQDADMVCLIEGKIAVSHPQAGAFTMDSPGTFFVAPHAAAPQPVASVPEGKLRAWAQETEATAGAGVARRAGQWQVVLLRDRYPRASAAATALRNAGFPAHLYRRVEGNYDVSLSDLATAADARAIAKALTGRFDIRSPQVSCREGQVCAREE